MIALEPGFTQLDEVTVSTGFQEISRERATGSFVKISNDLFNRKVSTNIIDRLEDITPGLVFNRNKNASGSISIRGQSTIFANADPLIVVDNFPYSGSIESINPNDVENVTVLKDAAAASIWGARSGNGVIVITTKKGSLGQPLKVSFNSNVTVGATPGLFYQSRMSSADFIEVEKMLFARGYYQSAENAAARTPLTPVVELLIAGRNGTMDAATVNEQIESLKTEDFRTDFTGYFYRNSVNQQYSLNMTGGGERQLYNFSVGYDKILASAVGDKNQRITLNAGNTYYFLNNKAVLSANISFTQSVNKNNSMDQTDLALTSANSFYSIYPYVRIADDNGNALVTTHNYRSTYISSLEGLPDWTYKPLEEQSLKNNTARNRDYRINTGFKYEIFRGLNVNVLYQYGLTDADTRNFYSERTFFTRDLINRFTQVSGSIYAYPVPKGAIVDLINGSRESQNFRAQLSYTGRWNDDDHSVDAIGGYEVQQVHYRGNSYRLYGYDEEHATSGVVDYVNTYRQYQNQSSMLAIPNSDDEMLTRDHYLSYYINAAYNYKRKYTVTGSARLDQSNLFGVKTNQKGVPLWSVGVGWDLSKEDFYTFSLIPELKFRLTYGYTGNVNKSVTAYTTAVYFGSSSSGVNLPYANISNPPNPSLKWERIKILNGSMSFATKKNIVSGTVEIYQKRGKDLIGDSPYPPSSGISLFRSNSADTKGTGVDVSIRSRNIDRSFKWTTDYLYSHILDKVTAYSSNATPMNYIANADGGGYPLKGRPLYALYSYKWAGLDPVTGDPQGYVNGEISKEYSGIINGTTIESMRYVGPARPADFGSVRNTFAYKNISVSANIAYRFGYYFRENGIDYSNVLKGLGYNYGDYSRRWQNQGDEAYTQVPSLPASINTNRDYLYRFSEILVKKADNIRLQDIAITYGFPARTLSKWKIDRLEFYLYANNLDVLWKAYSGNIDPDYVQADYKPVRTFSAGIRAGF